MQSDAQLVKNASVVASRGLHTFWVFLMVLSILWQVLSYLDGRASGWALVLLGVSMFFRLVHDTGRGGKFFLLLASGVLCLLSLILLVSASMGTPVVDLPVLTGVFGATSLQVIVLWIELELLS